MKWIATLVSLIESDLCLPNDMLVSINNVLCCYVPYTYVTGFWKTEQIVTLGIFLFIGPANGHTRTLHIRSAITRLSGLVCFSRASFADPVNS